MIIWPNLYNDLLIKPYKAGLSYLFVITGYSSSAFIHHVLDNFHNLKLDIILGMTGREPITIWDHNEYIRLVQTTGRLRVRYFVGSPPIHAKAAVWNDESYGSNTVFAGSANFSWHGFRDNQELMINTDFNNIKLLVPPSEYLVECTDPKVFNYVKVSYQREEDSNNINTSAVGAAVQGRPYVDLPLISRKTKKVPTRSGLNWGQREGREPNQAYIPIPKYIHNENPDFFPDRGAEFTLITDDGESFVCVVTQDNNKAIETKYDNSILGKYFRKRLGLSFGTLVESEHLKNYGRDFLTIYKIDSATYFMDFS